MFFLRCFSLHWMYFVSTFDIKIFIPNTNYGNQNNWKEHQIPCDQSHVIFSSKSPKVFINGTSTIYHISEMVLPVDGELIFDDSAILTVADLSRESNCDVIMSHFNKEHPDFWYNPMNWCQAYSTTSDCLKKPQVEASMVPSSIDTAVFRRKNTFYIGVKSSEPNIVVKQILLRENMYRSSFLFRKKISRTRSSNIVEFEKVNSRYPPIIDLKADKCKGDVCLVNSNLERMQHICSYVACSQSVSCKRPIKPTGSCCQLCGNQFSVMLHDYSSRRSFERWFKDITETNYHTKLIFNTLYVGKNKLEIVISSLDIESDVPDWLATEIVNRILFEKSLIGVDSVEGTSWTMTQLTKKTYGSALTIILIVCLIATSVIILFLLRRKLTWCPSFNVNFNTSYAQWPTFNFNFFRDSFPRTRMKEEEDKGTIPGSLFPSMSGAIEAIELPDKVTDISFDNPIYDADMVFEDSVQ